MSATLVVDRLSRVKRTKPGSWAAACPCCESRKGRPIAVTELPDGRVLLHAFCGCSTEDVLGRIGLSITDLFEKPVGNLPPTIFKVPASQILAALSHEAMVLFLLAEDLANGASFNDEMRIRLTTSAARIINAHEISLASER